MDMMFARHNRVWLSKTAWARVASVHGVESMHAQVFVQWADNNWPVVVRRREADLPADMVALGMPLPPASTNNEKNRLAFVVHRDDITRSEDPIHLLDITAALPSHWQSAYQNFCKEIASQQLELRVFGSFAMQAFTGLPYLRDSSDIDLLFAPHTSPQLAAGLALLSHYAKLLPLDGEIVFPSGRAVAWKEWLHVSASRKNIYVLTKSVQTVALVCADILLSELEDTLKDEAQGEPAVQTVGKYPNAPQDNQKNVSTAETKDA